jgi:hypothetical protein
MVLIYTKNNETLLIHQKNFVLTRKGITKADESIDYTHTVKTLFDGQIFYITEEEFYRIQELLID